MFLRLFKYLWPERYLPEPEQDDPFNEDPPPRAPGKVGVLLVNLGTPDAPRPGISASTWANSRPTRA